MKNKKISWVTYETIGIGIININAANAFFKRRKSVIILLEEEDEQNK